VLCINVTILCAVNSALSDFAFIVHLYCTSSRVHCASLLSIFIVRPHASSLCVFTEHCQFASYAVSYMWVLNVFLYYVHLHCASLMCVVNVRYHCSAFMFVRFVPTVLTILLLGTCLTFLIIIGDQFDRAFDSLIGPDFCKTWFLNRD